MSGRPFFNRISLAPALAAIAALVVLLLTLVAMQLVGHAMTRQAELDIGRDLAELAFQTTDKLDRGMYERYREVKLMAERYEITSPSVTVDAKRAALEGMQETHPYYAWIGLTDNRGTVGIATKRMLEGKDVSRRPWFAAAYRGVHLHDVHDAVLLAKLLPNPGNEPKRFFDVAFPYRGPDGQIAGILGTHLSWQWARDIERSVLRPLAERKDVDALILSKEGVVLLGPKAYADKRLALESVEAARRGLNASRIETWPDGRRYLVGYGQSGGHDTYPGLGWIVVVRQPVEQAFAPVDALRGRILGFGLAAAALVALLVWGMSRNIIKPLATITRHAEALRQGHSRGIPPVHSRLSEVQILQRALNGLLSKLLANEEGLRELNATLETRVAQRTAELHAAIDATREGERRVRAIIDTALDAFVGVDAQGRITDWNPRAEDIFGWRKDEVMGRTVTETIVPAPMRAAHEAGMRRYSISGSSGVVGKRIQLSALRRNGEEFPVEMTIGLIDAGDSHFFGTFIQDISVRRKIENDLVRERELLDAILESIDIGVVVCSREGAVTMFNRAAREIGGLAAALAPVGQGPGDDGPLPRVLRGETVDNTEVTVRIAGAPSRVLLASGRALQANDGSGIGAVIALKDVTTLKDAARRLEASERRLRTITDNVPALIGYVDAAERYSFANATYAAWFGVPADQVVGRSVREVLGETLYEAHRGNLDAAPGSIACFEMTLPAPGGARTVDIMRIPDIQDGACIGVYVLGTDVSAARRHEEELRQLARIDTLTGLPNRRAYQERLDEALQRSRRGGSIVALMYLDVDHFKQVNDTLGHAAGDLVLREFARRVKASVRSTDTVCRLAGDEFTVILEGLKAPGEAALVAEKIVAAFARPFALEHGERMVSTSIGVAIAGTPPADADALAAHADKALYEAKRRGRGCYAMVTPEVAPAVPLNG